MSASHPTQKPLVWPNYGPVSVVAKPRQISRNAEESPRRGRKKQSAIWSALLLAIAVSQTGCSSLSTTTFVKAEVPVNLAQPCPDLPDIPDRSERSVAEWIVQTVTLYYQCAAKHSAVVEAVK
jgi:hypothetical protein